MVIVVDSSYNNISSSIGGGSGSGSSWLSLTWKPIRDHVVLLIEITNEAYYMCKMSCQSDELCRK